MNSLKQELIEGLKKIPENDRDLRSLTIWCNPNYIRGADRDISVEILKILKNLEKKNKVKKIKKKLATFQYDQRKKEYELWSLI